jgi:hypothetical protein
MAIKQRCFCDRCNKLLSCGEDGFAFLGNVHAIGDHTKDFIGGGLIGNNLEGSTLGDDAVVFNVTHYCTKCTIDVLGIKLDSVRAHTPSNARTPII